MLIAIIHSKDDPLAVTLTALQPQLSIDDDIYIVDTTDNRQGLEIAKKAYEVGSKTLLDVQNAEHQLNSAKVAFNAAQYNYHIAIINLKLLMSDL